MNRKPQEETEEINEEPDYINEAVCTVEKMAVPRDQRFRFFSRFFPLIAACWLILLVIMGLRIHFTSVISKNNAKLTAEIQNLKTQNQDLETQKNNLTKQIQVMETNWNELNASRAQWSINAYCLRNDDKRCGPCQIGWLHTDPNCYVTLNAVEKDRKTWEEAQENCNENNAALAVIHDQKEKDVVRDYSWGSSGTTGYWIGLRVVDGKWKWIDGSDLTVNSWIEAPSDGHCAISVINAGWKSVRCDDKQQWICRQKALSV